MRGFSPTIDAAAELQKELGIITNTVEHLVLIKPEDTKNQLWIIDEAGMVSTRQMQAIARKAESVGARILLVGDKGQHSSVEAGSPFRSLIDHGATTHSIRQIIRQQNSIQRQAVELIASGNGMAALEHLNKNGYVKELESRSERTSAIAQQYLALSEKERDKTLIVTGTNAERLSITKAIRTGLRAEGKLGESVKAVQLVSRHLTDEQAKQTQNYQVGDYLRLHRDYHSTSLQKGQLYKVERVDNEQLLVSSYGGRLYRFDPSKYKDKEVFSAQKIELAVGDSLRWTATDKKQSRINGKQFTVAAFEGTAMTVTNHQGRTQEVSLLQPLALDYSLVSTSYRAQGKTAKRVIVSATSDPTSSREPFYVKISRQTKELNVYTQDLEQHKGWVKRSNAQQNPLELIGEYYDKQRTARTSPEARRNRRALAEKQVETELTETLLEANKAVERLDQSISQAIQTERLETLSNALTEWRLGQGLAEAISTLDENSDIQMKGELERIGEAIAQLQSLNILDPDLEQLVSVVDQWQAEQRGTETGQIVELAEQLQSLNEEHLLDESGLDEKLADLTGQIERFNAIRQHEQFEGIDSLAEAVTELGQEEALTNSNLKTKLNELTLALKQLEARFTPTSFQGMKELAQAVSQHKADSAIAAHLAQFEQVTEQVEQMVLNHPDQQQLTQVVRSLQETATITGEIGSEELQDLAKRLRQRQQKAAQMPQKLEAFWEPQYPSEPPRHLQLKHWEEFKQSAIHPDLIALNAQSISDSQVYERLLSEKFTNPKYGAGQYVTVPIARELKKYEQIAEGGWWGNAGIDALSSDRS